MKPSLRTVQLTLLVAGLLAIGSTASAGDDMAAAAKDVLAGITKAQKDPEHSGLSEALEQVPGVHNALKDAGLRKKLQKAVGKTLRAKDAGNARRTAASVLGRLNDPKGAYAQLSKVLPAAKDKKASPAQLEAIRATAVLAPDAAIAPLIKLMRSGKALPASKEAIVALGSYGKSKKREAILKELLEVTSLRLSAAKAAESNPKGGSGGKAWKALGESLVASCNRLTGQSHPSGEEWLSTYKAHKKKLRELFADAAN